MDTDWLDTKSQPNEHDFFQLMRQTFPRRVRSEEELISSSALLLKLVKQANEHTDRQQSGAHLISKEKQTVQFTVAQTNPKKQKHL